MVVPLAFLLTSQALRCQGLRLVQQAAAGVVQAQAYTLDDVLILLELEFINSGITGVA